MYCLLPVLLVAIAPWACVGEGEYIIYDFYSSQSRAGVLSSFRSVRTHHKFKVFGIQRYLIVVENDQSSAMKNLRLPIDSYNVRATPTEHLDIFLSHFEPTFPNDSGPKPLPDTDLTYVERTLSSGCNEKELKAVIKERSLSYRKSDIDIFVKTASIPTKEFMFMSRSDFQVVEELVKRMDDLGGSRCQKIASLETYKIYKI